LSEFRTIEDALQFRKQWGAANKLHGPWRPQSGGRTYRPITVPR
jgi:hypothetical protein